MTGCARLFFVYQRGFCGQIKLGKHCIMVVLCPLFIVLSQQTLDVMEHVCLLQSHHESGLHYIHKYLMFALIDTTIHKRRDGKLDTDEDTVCYRLTKCRDVTLCSLCSVVAGRTSYQRIKYLP